MSAMWWQGPGRERINAHRRVARPQLAFWSGLALVFLISGCVPAPVSPIPDTPSPDRSTSTPAQTRPAETPAAATTVTLLPTITPRATLAIANATPAGTAAPTPIATFTRTPSPSPTVVSFSFPLDLQGGTLWRFAGDPGLERMGETIRSVLEREKVSFSGPLETVYGFEPGEGYAHIFARDSASMAELIPYYYPEAYLRTFVEAFLAQQY